MHTEDLSPWQHSHRFQSGQETGNERRTLLVLGLTATMMVIEIAAGTVFHSMALLADGWHMSTHVGAMAIAALAYGFARRHADNRHFAFGTGKVGSLAGFTSAIILAIIALLMAYESVTRLVSPTAISFDQAIPVAVVGLMVNLASAWILGGHGHHHDDHHHAHDHHGDHHHHHDHGHADHNIRAAYVHVLADAVTSVLAIVALLLGKFAGWDWMDPVMGIVGTGVIANWCYGLVKESSRTLLDWNADAALEDEVRQAIEADADNRVTDLHLWRVGPGHFAAALSLVTHQPRDPSHYRQLLAVVHELSHITIEVNHCR